MRLRTIPLHPGSRSLQQGAEEYSSSPRNVRERLCDLGVRVPIGNRFSVAASSLQRGALSPEGASDEVLLVSDFLPWSLDAYEKSQPAEKKMELRKKQGMSIEKFATAGRQHTLLFALCYGRGHAQERLASLFGAWENPRS